MCQWSRVQTIESTPPENQHDNGKTTMNEDVSPIKTGDFPACHVSFRGGLLEYAKGFSVS